MVKSMLKLIIPSLFFKCKIQFSLGVLLNHHSGFLNHQQVKESLSSLRQTVNPQTYTPGIQSSWSGASVVRG